MRSRLELSATYGGVPLCGGQGTRLASIIEAQGGVPKPLVEVGGFKLIEYTTALMDPNVIPEIVFTLGYKADQIKNWVDNADLTHNVQVAYQKTPGALNAMTEGVAILPSNKAIVANSDEIRNNFDLRDALTYHESTGKLATILTTYSNNLVRHRVVTARPDGIVTKTEKQPYRFEEKPESVGLINAGILIFDKKALEYADSSHDVDWGGLLDPLTESGELTAYVASGMNFFNVGTPEEYYEAHAFLSLGEEAIAS